MRYTERLYGDTATTGEISRKVKGILITQSKGDRSRILTTEDYHKKEQTAVLSLP